jgi:OOP family OmpA-OmpF porin
MTSKKILAVALLFAFGTTACGRGTAPKGDAGGTPAASEAPAASAMPASPGAAARAPFDLSSVPLATVPLPPFPFLAFPRDLKPGMATENKGVEFDATELIVGADLRTVEGRTNQLAFSNVDAKYSALSSRRNYEAAIKALGGVKVNSIDPDNAALVAQYGERLKRLDARHVGGGASYDVYLIRAADKLAWITLMVTDANTFVKVVEEKALEQTVGYVTADAMRSALDSAGHIALYINFDTDKATIQTEGKAAVDEIAALLKSSPTLKLTIEGHTDNSGDAASNQVLSQQRAGAVMAALVAGGIDAARLKAVGMGATKPIADNGAATGRAKNRRVELVKASAG